MNTAEAILVEASSSVEALSRAVDIEGKFLHFFYGSSHQISKLQVKPNEEVECFTLHR